jgi:hypothetical protein
MLRIIALAMPLLLPAVTHAQTSAVEDATLSRSLRDSPAAYFYDHHIEGVGLVLVGSKANTETALLGRVRGNLDDKKFSDGTVPNPLLKSKTLYEGGLDRFVLVARLQNGLDVDESKAQAATYQWIRDAQAGTFWNVDAAVILDWYFPAGGLANIFAYRPESLAAHLRTGFAWERSTTGSDSTSVDLREVFVGVGLRRTFNINDPKQQSEFQIGLSFKENAITNDNQWSVNLNVQPVFTFLPWIPWFKNKNYVIGEHWILSKSDRTKPAPAPTDVPPSPDLATGTSPLEQIKHYFYIKPNLTLKSVFSDFTKNRNIDPGDYQVDWGNRLGYGFFHDKMRISYQLSGVTPLDQIDRSFIFQEARAEVGPFPSFPAVFSARYTKGKRAPSYVNEDRITLSVGAKF